MNWKQAMAAMVEGHKVRGSDYAPSTWISADGGTSDMFFRYSELQAMDWEIYEEPTDLHDFDSKAIIAMRNIFEQALEDIEKLKIR